MKFHYLLIVFMFYSFKLLSQKENIDSIKKAIKESAELTQLLDAEEWLQKELLDRKEELKQNPQRIRSHSFSITENDFYLFTPNQREKLLQIRWIIYRALKENNIDTIHRYMRNYSAYQIQWAFEFKGMLNDWSKKIKNLDSVLQLAKNYDKEVSEFEYKKYYEKYFPDGINEIEKKIEEESTFIKNENLKNQGLVKKIDDIIFLINKQNFFSLGCMENKTYFII